VSHMSVMVEGDDVDGQMAPYGDFEATCDDRFVQEIDDTDEALSQIAWEMENGTPSFVGAAHRSGFPIATGRHDLDLERRHKYGFSIVRFGRLIECVRRTNPDSRWDWWAEGGRYSDFFLLKDGTSSFTALASDIDVVGMVERAKKERGDLYDGCHKIIAGRPWVTRSELVEKCKGDYNKAYKLFTRQKVYRDLYKLWEDRYLLNRTSMDEFKLTRQEFIACQCVNVFETAAIVRDGAWWDSEDEYCDVPPHTPESILALPPSTRLTVVDCHF